MFMYGTTQEEPRRMLSWLDRQNLFTMLRHPDDQERITLVERLRNLTNLNHDEAQTISKRLPYVLFGRFNPMCYKACNYSGSDYLCLDIYHFPCMPSEHRFEVWRQKLTSDRNLSMCFLSADASCLHLVFQLRRRCYDKGLFRLLYREFAHDFFLRHEISEEPVFASSDPCKAIPIGLDSNAYYCIGNPPIRLEDYVNYSSIEALHEQKRKRQQKTMSKHSNKDDKDTPSVTDEQLSAIKSILNHNSHHK